MERVKEEVTYLDTHVVIWLYDGKVGELSRAAAEQIRNDNLFISPAVILELELLHEIQRLRPTALHMIAVLSEDVGLSVSQLSFAAVVEIALHQKWVRDPFDRLIVAHASAHDAPLITRDEKIRRHYRFALW